MQPLQKRHLNVRLSPISFSLLLAFSTIIAPEPGSAQGTRADYERARNLRRLTENKVFRERVEPHWLSGNTQFWYQVKTGPETSEFIMVDALRGVRQRAFDHERLAKALRESGVKDARADRLPIGKVSFKPVEGVVEFEAGGKGWGCSLSNYTLLPQPTREEKLASVSVDAVPSASRRTGPETAITFVNTSAGAVELFWLDTNGERHSYGKLPPGEQRTQHTYAGHAWLAVDDSGKTLNGFVAGEAAGRAEIFRQAVTPTPTETAPKPRRSSRDTSPNGRWQAFVKDYNLMARNLNTGEEVALSSDGNAEDSYSDRVYWSPDSRFVVSLRTKKGDERKVYLIESSPKDQLQPKLHNFEYRKPGDAVPSPKPQLFDVEKEKQIKINDALFPKPWSISELRWERDSSRFTFLYNERGHQVLRLVSVDAATGQTEAIINEESQTFIDYAGKYFLQALENSNEIIWMSERDGWNHLYLYDAKSGKVKNQITRGEWVVRNVDQVDEKKRQIWFRAGGIHSGQDPYHIHYCRINFDGTGLTTLTARRRHT